MNRISPVKDSQMLSFFMDPTIVFHSPANLFVRAYIFENRGEDELFMLDSCRITPLWFEGEKSSCPSDKQGLDGVCLWHYNQ